MSVCLIVCLSVCLIVCLPVWLSVCLSVCLPVCLVVCLPVWLSACLIVCLPVCLIVCLPACLSVCLSDCLSHCLSVYQRNWHELRTVDCDLNITGEFLCEKRSEVPAETREIQLFNVSGQPSENYITCPAGHVTHAFLACDPQSVCYVDGDTENAECLAPLTPLPPSFLCSNGEMRVPYTVVCDFRYDCWDRSDESFCDFLQCSGSGMFDCGNGQVQHFQFFLKDAVVKLPLKKPALSLKLLKNN